MKKVLAIFSGLAVSSLALFSLNASAQTVIGSDSQSYGMGGANTRVTDVTIDAAAGGTGVSEVILSSSLNGTPEDTGVILRGVATADAPIDDPATDDAFLNWAASVEYVEMRLAEAGGGGGGVAPDQDGNIIIENADTEAGTSSNVGITSDSFSATVTNADGNTLGLNIGTTQTTLSGGTGTTVLTLNDSGATFDDGSGNAVVVSGIAPGVFGTDAVNVNQLDAAMGLVRDDAFAGIAIANALDVVLPQEGNNLSMRLGAGYYQSASAYGLSLVGRVRDNVFIDVGYGLSTEKNSGSYNGGKAGITLQW